MHLFKPLVINAPQDFGGRLASMLWDVEARNFRGKAGRLLLDRSCHELGWGSEFEGLEGQGKFSIRPGLHLFFVFVFPPPLRNCASNIELSATCFCCRTPAGSGQGATGDCGRRNEGCFLLLGTDRCSTFPKSSTSTCSLEDKFVRMLRSSGMS